MIFFVLTWWIINEFEKGKENPGVEERVFGVARTQRCVTETGPELD